MTKRLLTVLVLLAATALAQTTPYDLVIRNGRIVDGTGSPWYSGDVGIRNGRIADIGNLADRPTRRTIDAAGNVVAQWERTILVNPHLPSKIFEGITTEITGEGESVAPLDDRIRQTDRISY